MGKFDEFLPYVLADEDAGKINDASRTGNAFARVSEAEIRAAEARIGFRLPEGLREFYLEVGWGYLQFPSDYPRKKQANLDNIVVRPKHLAEIYLKESQDWEITDLDREHYEYIGEEIPEKYPLVTDSDLPFFHIDDRAYFVMRPHSDMPEAVYQAVYRPDYMVARNMEEFIKGTHRDPRTHSIDL